jgi:uncharacterized cupin superfamily protein
MEPVNEGDLDWDETDRGQTRFRRKRLGAAAGGESLGCSLYEVPPGGRSWPYHYHTANEEALFVLDGRGTLRAGETTHPLRPGDYVAFPVGESGAHRVRNDGDEPLRYLVVSTMTEPDVTVYPDSGKLGVFAGAPPGGQGERTVHGYFRQADAVDYWTDEEPDE